jgi:hypothetical protein
MPSISPKSVRTLDFWYTTTMASARADLLDFEKAESEEHYIRRMEAQSGKHLAKTGF